MSKIIDGLYIGSQEDANNLDYLSSHQVTAIVALGCGEPYSDKFEYCSFPQLLDKPEAIILDVFEVAVQYIIDKLKQNKVVLVHCVYGQSRSAAVCVAYLMAAGRSLEAALGEVKAARDIMCINPGFLGQLYLLAHRSEYFAEYAIIHHSGMLKLHIGNSSTSESNCEGAHDGVFCKRCKGRLAHCDDIWDSGQATAPLLKYFIECHVDDFYRGYRPLLSARPVVQDDAVLLRYLPWMKMNMDHDSESLLLCPHCQHPCGEWRDAAVVACAGYLLCDLFALSLSCVVVRAVEQTSTASKNRNSNQYLSKKQRKR